MYRWFCFFWHSQLSLWILRWIMTPIFAWNMLWACCSRWWIKAWLDLSFFSNFFFLDSKIFVPFLTIVIQIFLSIAMDSRRLMSMLHFLMFCLRTLLNLVIWSLFWFRFWVGSKSFALVVGCEPFCSDGHSMEDHFHDDCFIAANLISFQYADVSASIFPSDV